MSSNLFTELRGLENSLDFHSQRHSVLTANLANADTPGYVPRDVTFEQNMLAAPMQLTAPGHVAGAINPQVNVAEVPSERHFDGSGVEMEQAMSQLMGNRLRYETGIEMTRRRLGMLRYAASNGGAS